MLMETCSITVVARAVHHHVDYVELPEVNYNSVIPSPLEVENSHRLYIFFHLRC